MLEKLKGLEDYHQSRILTQDKCIKIVAWMIKKWILDDNADLLGVDDYEEFNDHYWGWKSHYYEEMARMYLEHNYNKWSKYSVNENLIYLSWKYCAFSEQFIYPLTINIKWR